jgi:DNA-binding winged helix-turn-helix (wHTH) protein
MAYVAACSDEGVRRYRFGAFALDIEERWLMRDGEPVPLQPRAFDLLAYMVNNAGRLLTKQTLLDELWSGAYVTENSLTQSVRQLRSALMDEVAAPRYIATVPRIGYRFIAPVEIDGDESAAADAAPWRPMAQDAPSQGTAIAPGHGGTVVVDDARLTVIEQRLNAAQRDEVRALYVQGEAGGGDATLIERYRSLLSAFFDALASDTWVTVAVIEEPRPRHCAPPVHSHAAR